MKKSKLALLAGVAAASTLFLAACGSSSNASKGTTYNYVYGTDPDSLNYLTSNLQLQATLQPTWSMVCLKTINTVT